MKKALVSVIIPVYNEEKYITNCIKTLQNQSYKNIEIIIIDDGSTDKTLSILNNFKGLKIFKQNHLGPGIARNLGVKNSKGDIFVFVDADMEFDKEYIKSLVEPILEKKVFGTIHILEEVANKDNIWAKCWGSRPTVDKSNQGLIYRAITREAFLKYGPFNPKKGYADDRTIYDNSNIKSVGVDAKCYHNNPSSLKEVFIQSKWIGSSNSSKLIKIPVINFIFSLIGYFLIFSYIVYLTFKKIIEFKEFSLLFYYPIFGIVKYTGYFLGIFKRIFFKKVIK